jgi:hypothetical protein
MPRKNWGYPNVEMTTRREFFKMAVQTASAALLSGHPIGALGRLGVDHSDGGRSTRSYGDSSHSAYFISEGATAAGEQSGVAPHC